METSPHDGLSIHRRGIVGGNPLSSGNVGHDGGAAIPPDLHIKIVVGLPGGGDHAPAKNLAPLEAAIQAATNPFESTADRKLVAQLPNLVSQHREVIELPFQLGFFRLKALQVFQQKLAIPLGNFQLALRISNLGFEVGNRTGQGLHLLGHAFAFILEARDPFVPAPDFLPGGFGGRFGLDLGFVETGRKDGDIIRVGLEFLRLGGHVALKVDSVDPCAVQFVRDLGHLIRKVMDLRDVFNFLFLRGAVAVDQSSREDQRDEGEDDCHNLQVHSLHRMLGLIAFGKRASES